MDDGLTENKLLKSAQRGDLEAYEAIVKRFEKLLINIAYRLLNSREDAEDAAYEAFIKAHLNLSRCKGGLKPWLCAITRNCCIDMLRKRKDVVYIDAAVDGDKSVFLQIPDSNLSPEGAAIEGERLEALERAIAALKPAFREVIIFIAIQGLSYEETARITGVPEGTVKSRLNRARAALRLHMKDYYDGR